MALGFARFLLARSTNPLAAWRVWKLARYRPAAPVRPVVLGLRENGRVLRLRVHDAAEAEMVHEIFYRRAYAAGPLGEGGVILDVGANAGFAALFFAATYPGAPIHAVEPLPANLDRLRAHVAANSLGDRVTVHPFGLGASTRRADLFVDAGGSGGNATLLAGRDRGRGLGEVEIHRASEFLDSLGPVALMKLDCEGAEGEILDDLAARFDRIGAIVGEMHPALCDPAEALALLTRSYRVETTAAPGAQYFDFIARK